MLKVGENYRGNTASESQKAHDIEGENPPFGILV